MKIIILLYLEEDQGCVTRFLKDNGVMAYSQLPLEGHGAGVAGWYGSTAPYASRMAFTVVPEAQAQAICMEHPDFREANDAWSQKRDPQWR